jgi:hypothetical protein
MKQLRQVIWVRQYFGAEHIWVWDLHSKFENRKPKQTNKQTNLQMMNITFSFVEYAEYSPSWRGCCARLLRLVVLRSNQSHWVADNSERVGAKVGVAEAVVAAIVRSRRRSSAHSHCQGRAAACPHSRERSGCSQAEAEKGGSAEVAHWKVQAVRPPFAPRWCS